MAHQRWNVVLFCIGLSLVMGVFGTSLTGCVIRKGSPTTAEERRQDQESKAFVDSLLPQILTTWDSGLLVDHATHSLLKSTPPEAVASMFKAFSRKLGPLETYEGSYGMTRTVKTRKGTFLVASYKVVGIFKYGPAEIILKLIHRDNQWKIYQFQVNSEALTVM